MEEICGGYKKPRSRIVKFEKPFRHPNADVTQAGKYGSPEFMENVWPGVISIEVVFKTLDQIKEVTVNREEQRSQELGSAFICQADEDEPAKQTEEEHPQSRREKSECGILEAKKVFKKINSVLSFPTHIITLDYK